MANSVGRSVLKWSIVSILLAIVLWVGATIRSVYVRAAAIETVQANFDCSFKVGGRVSQYDLFGKMLGLPPRLDNVALSGRAQINDYSENVEEAIVAAGHVEVLCLISPTEREMDLASLFPSAKFVRVFSVNQSREIFQLDWLAGLHCDSLSINTDRSVTAVPYIEKMHSLGFTTCSNLDERTLAESLRLNPQLTTLYVVNCEEIGDSFLTQLESTYTNLAIKTDLNGER